MTPIEFCYWLQGALELGCSKTLNEEQVKVLNEHLNLVFKKVTSPAKLGPGIASPGLTPLDGVRNVPWVGPYIPPMVNPPYSPNTIWCSNSGQTPVATPQNITLREAISLSSAKETVLADLKKGTLSAEC